MCGNSKQKTGTQADTENHQKSYIYEQERRSKPVNLGAQSGAIYPDEELILLRWHGKVRS